MGISKTYKTKLNDIMDLDRFVEFCEKRYDTTIIDISFSQHKTFSVHLYRGSRDRCYCLGEYNNTFPVNYAEIIKHFDKILNK